MDNELAIYLNDLHVGVLRCSHKTAHEFRFIRSYQETYPRPVLGQMFEDDLERVHKSSVRLPPFFANLLPEGALREFIAKQVGVKEIHEFFLLAHLGNDLPGAVRAVPLTDLDRVSAGLAASESQVNAGLRFSLAGVQLKFSMLREANKLTLPMTDQYGDWIVKLPDQRYDGVPENEFSMLQWASAAGIDTPEHELVAMSDLQGLPDGIAHAGAQALAVRRFDRPAGQPRVHQEDFAQIFNLYPDHKYARHNYESIARTVLKTAGMSAFEQFLDRLVFTVVSGNADAHHKNWSLRYEDGVAAQLSPAYDLVATILYPEVSSELALNFARSKKFTDVRQESFIRLARKLDVSEDAVKNRVRDALDRIRDAWSTIRRELPISAADKDTIERHGRRIPLVSGPSSGFTARATRRQSELS